MAKVRTGWDASHQAPRVLNVIGAYFIPLSTQHHQQALAKVSHAPLGTFYVSLRRSPDEQSRAPPETPRYRKVFLGL